MTVGRQETTQKNKQMREGEMEKKGRSVKEGGAAKDGGISGQTGKLDCNEDGADLMWVHMSPPDTITGGDRTRREAEGHNNSVWLGRCVLLFALTNTREKSRFMVHFRIW